jgi:hypothetical protein
MKLLVNGEVRELNIYDSNGIDWSNDLIGNNTDWSQYKTDEDTELKIVDEEFFNWWSEYIENYTADEEEMNDLVAEFDLDASDIKLRIADEMDGRDMEQEHYIKQKIFDEIRVLNLTDIEMNESCHEDYPEEYDNKLDFYLSNAEKDSYINYLTENYNNIDSDKAAEIQEAVISEIKKRWEAIQAAAAALGRKGGSVKSAAKARASRENGKLGGRPRKSEQ